MVLIVVVLERFNFTRDCFRPLAGIMVLITEKNCRKESRAKIVSVPLRGLWFLSGQILKRTIRITESVSVPLRGLWFLSVATEMAISRNVVKRFRPLAGIMVLIGGKMPTLKEYRERVSVPLRGLWFLSTRGL